MSLSRRRALVSFAALAVALAWTYRPALHGQLLAGRDAFRYYFPAAAFTLESLGRGELPLWNPYLRLGQPFAASLATQGLYPPAWLCSALLGPVRGFTLQQILHAGLAAVGVFLLARRLRCSWPAALAGAAAFGLTPLLTDLNGQRNVVDAAAWTGLLLVAAIELAERPRARAAGWLALAGALSFLAGSPETTLWQGLLALGVIAAFARTRAALAWAAASAGWVVALSGVLLLPAIELARHSSRGGAFHEPLDWSASAVQLWAMAWPGADLPRGEYWGEDQWFLVTLFVGTLTCAFALASLRRSRRVWPFAAAAVLLALLSLGKHFPPSAWLLTHPPLSAFRYPAKYLVGVAFCLAALAPQGIDRLAALAGRRRASLAGAGSAVLAALVALALGPPALRALGARAGATSGLLWTVLALALAAVAVALAPGLRRRASALRWSLASLLLLELLAYQARGSFGWERPGRMDQPSLLAREIPPGFQGRVSLPMNDAPLFKLAEGASTLMARSRDALVPNRSVEERLRALEGYGTPEPDTLDAFQHIGKRAVFDLAGVAYYVRPGPPPYPDLALVASPPGLPSLYRSDTAMPRAFVVHQAEVVTDAQAVEKIWSDAEPARRTAYLASGEPLSSPCEGSTAKLAKDALQEVAVDAWSCGPGYLVLSDAYFPGWEATVDGKEVPLLRADFALRAVRIDAGAHRIEFRYRPLSFRVGAALTLAGLAALAAASLKRRAARP